jgi:hypothetical protein
MLASFSDISSMECVLVADALEEVVLNMLLPLAAVAVGIVTGVVLLTKDVNEYSISEETGAKVIQASSEHEVVVKSNVVSKETVDVLPCKQESSLQCVVVRIKVVSLDTVLVDQEIGGTGMLVVGSTEVVGSVDVVESAELVGSVDVVGSAEVLEDSAVEVGILVGSTVNVVALLESIAVTVVVTVSLGPVTELVEELDKDSELEVTAILVPVTVTVVSGMVTVSVTVKF